MTKQKHKPRLEYIEWIDHSSGVGWIDNTEVDLESSIIKCRAAGFVIAETPRVVCLGNFCTDGGSHSRQYIVKAAITKRRSLKAPK